MKALIIEDEEIIGKALANTIKKVDKDIEVIDILPSLKVARKWFGANAEPDILFMDIQLSDGVSFDLLAQYTVNCPIVFTTAYDEYAIRAFKVNGVDYLLKPVEEEDLKKAIDKCKNVISRKSGAPVDMAELIKGLTSPGNISGKYKQRFIVNIRNQWMPIPVKDIAVFAKDVLNYIYLFNGEKYLVDVNTLDEVEEVVDPGQFYRANRQFIINIDAIQAVRSIENSKLLIKLKAPNDKFEIDMSREKTPVFKKWMDR